MPRKALLLVAFATILAVVFGAPGAAGARAGGAATRRNCHSSITRPRGSASTITRPRAGRARRCSTRVSATRSHSHSALRSRRLRATVPKSRVPAQALENAGTLAASHAATIAAVLATPCQYVELTPEAANGAQIRSAVLCLVNRVRAQNGEAPLALNPALSLAAEQHAQELVQDNYFAHVAPGGETPVDRVRSDGYIPAPTSGYVIGENLAWGTYNLSTPSSIVAAWVASPGHLANILEAQYRETGIGITAAVPGSLAGGAPGATYAQEFGVIVE